jgi:broad specificity phosphatase PhoE
MAGPAALPNSSSGAGGQATGSRSRSNSPPLRRIVSEATLVAEEPPRPLRVALRESSLGGSTALLPPPSSGSRRSSPEAAFGRPAEAAVGGPLLLRGRSASAPKTPAPDSDEQDGVVASAPLLAQNDHYKRSATSAPDAAVGAGASGDDAGDVSEDAPTQPLTVYEAEPAIYTSTLPRTIDMVGELPFPSQQLSALNPMDTGICLGIPMQYMRSNFPDEFRMWMEAPDRARYRIPGGESLMDVVERLTPFVIEIERQRRPVVVVSHLSTLQVLLAYFKGVPLQECIDLECPMNTVVRHTGDAERGCCSAFSSVHLTCAGDTLRVLFPSERMRAYFTGPC